jgi:1-aminocyclopropane-1-carboxylate deaminase/D-cysteine desulfhydrase-like pyridoxal-dependent ACC family enzyme
VKRLSKLFGGHKIIFKRDDATGLGLGGQKVRMLEFPLGDAVSKGCDVIVSTGSEDANLATLLAACSRKLGMDIVFIYLKKSREELEGNALLTNLLDPVIIQTNLEYTTKDQIAESRQRVIDTMEELRKRGRNPYPIDFGTQEPLGDVGIFYCVQEVMQQLENRKETAQYFYTANAGGVTQGGLVLGAKYFNAPFKVIGTLCVPGFTKEERPTRMAEIINEASRRLGTGITVEPEEIILRDGYQGEHAGPLKQTTQECIDAIRLVARTEGIFLDPHWTGKSMAALIDDIRTGKLTSRDQVIFYHSGGAPSIFPYHKELQIRNRDSIEAM